jgi:hypothetical protein
MELNKLIQSLRGAHANINALYLLPRALCPLCRTVHLGGMFSIGEYPHHRGYCFLWESASPLHIRLLAIVCQREGLALDTLLQIAPYPFTESALPAARSVLAWIEGNYSAPLCPWDKSPKRIECKRKIW